MAGSTYGTEFTITTWGESHGAAVGVVIDGCPAGLPLSEADIQPYMDRRRPGQSAVTTGRKESDTARILSGVFEGKTTGTPLCILIPNTDQHSEDYEQLKDCYRPGHADYSYDQKYGFRDWRGGGRSSGRETAGRVAAGAVAAKILGEMGITVCAYTKAIGEITVPEEEYDLSCLKDNPFYMPSQSYAAKAEEYVREKQKEQDSCGGIIECTVTGLPAGIGEPVFDKLDAALAQAVMSIGAVKGVEIGDGFSAAAATGSRNNDAFFSEDGKIKKKTNHAGGILGGISDGSRLILRAAVKPTPSIGQEQETVTVRGENTKISIAGRHDPVIVPRAVVVVEAMTAVTLVDLLLTNMGSKMENLKKIYDTDT